MVIDWGRGMLVCFFFGQFLTGCPKATQDNDGTAVRAADAASQEAFLDSFVQVGCNWAERCPSFSEISGPDCIESLKNNLLSSPLLGDPPLHYDSAAGLSCLRQFESAPCASWLELPACQGVFTGDSGVGEACSFTPNCQPGLLCDLGSSCPGVCAPTPRENEPCVDSECGEGLQCSQDICVRATRLQRGEACDGAVACADGLTCDLYNGGSNTCQPDDEVYYTHGTGEKCSGDAFCQPGLYCDVLLTTPTCTRVVGEGESCVRDESCAEGLHCSSELHECVANFPLGSECFTDAVCARGECIRATCGFPAALGEACVVDEECSSAYCKNSVCTRQSGCGI